MTEGSKVVAFYFKSSSKYLERIWDKIFYNQNLNWFLWRHVKTKSCLSNKKWNVLPTSIIINSYKTQVKQTHLTIHDQFQFPQKHPPSDGRLLELDFESNVLPGFQAKMLHFNDTHTPISNSAEIANDGHLNHKPFNQMHFTLYL